MRGRDNLERSAAGLDSEASGSPFELDARAAYGYVAVWCIEKTEGYHVFGQGIAVSIMHLLHPTLEHQYSRDRPPAADMAALSLSSAFEVDRILTLKYAKSSSLPSSSTQSNCNTPLIFDHLLLALPKFNSSDQRRQR